MSEFPIIDIHAHVIPRICGRNRFGALSSARWGRVERGSQQLPMLPPTCADSTFPVEALVEVMDREGVAQAVLMQNPTWGIFNEYIRECVSRFPSRFCGTIQVDPRARDAVATLRCFASTSQHTLKLELSYDWGWTGIYPGFRIDEPGMEPVWKAVADLGLEVVLDPGQPGNAGYQVEAFEALAERFPTTRFVLEHLGYPVPGLEGDGPAQSRRRRLLELGRRPNVWFGVSAVPTLLEEIYPCPRSVALLREAVELLGAKKLLWGSDLPGTLGLHTYRQLADVVRREAAFLDEPALRQILHDNARTVFKGLTAN